MRIAIVNDMPMALEGLRRVIEGTGTHQIAWTAFTGDEAISACQVDRPDLLLMDIIMPGMNGVETTREIMRSTPCPILLVTSSVNKNSALVFEAMGYGALDAINTPVLSNSGENVSQESLLKKISMLSILTQTSISDDGSFSYFDKLNCTHSARQSLIAIGSSSGGPQALATILKSIPRDFNVPIVIVQHVDRQFAAGLADWLSSLANIPVRVVRAGDKPESGVISLAGSDDHLVLTKDGVFQYTETPCDTPYRPSVDVFFGSLEQHWKGSITAVLLTGMGKDGAKSMLKLRQSGAYTIAQDEQTCAVFGMPKAALELGAAVDILPIDNIANSLLKKC